MVSQQRGTNLEKFRRLLLTAKLTEGFQLLEHVQRGIGKSLHQGLNLVLAALDMGCRSAQHILQDVSCLLHLPAVLLPQSL